METTAPDTTGLPAVLRSAALDSLAMTLCRKASKDLLIELGEHLSRSMSSVKAYARAPGLKGMVMYALVNTSSFCSSSFHVDEDKTEELITHLEKLKLAWQGLLDLDIHCHANDGSVGMDRIEIRISVSS